MFLEHLHNFWLRMKAVVKRRQLERDLAEELEFHLAMREQKLIEQGMSPREAHYAARRGFGNVVSLKETSRDFWSFPTLESILQDVRYGLRQLSCNPGFTALAVITLALGIGGTTAIFNVLYGGLLHPLPYKDVDRLVILGTHDRSQPLFDSDWAWVSTAEFLDFQEQNHVFDQVLGGVSVNMLLTGSDIPTASFRALRLSPNAFQVLGMSPLIGRALTSEDARPGGPPVILLSYKMWQYKFAGDAAILGRTVTLNRQPTTVVGVMPPRFNWFGEPDAWLPTVFSRSGSNLQGQDTPVIGHLKPGVTIAQASADLELAAKPLAAIYPKYHPPGITYFVESLTDACVDRQSVRTMNILMGGVGLLLLIACVNVANMLLARATSRERELAIRASLGAGRLRLIRQLLIEGLLLGLGGAVFGCLLAWNAQHILVAIIPAAWLPSEAEVHMNGWVILFAAGAALASTLLFGVAPAVVAVRKDMQSPLKASGRGAGESLSHHRLRSLLVVSEITLALTLLTGAGLLFRSFWTLRHVELGYSVDHVLRVEARLPEETYKTPEQRNQFHLEILRRVRALPGVISAALGLGSMNWSTPTPIEVSGLPADQSQSAWFRLVSDKFFETMAIRLFQGRTISEEDLVHRRPVVVINRAFANKYFAHQNALGREIKVMLPPWFPPLPQPIYEIVGIVGDTTHGGGVGVPTIQPQIFLPYSLNGFPYVIVFVRTAGDPAGLVNPIRREFAALDKELPVDTTLAKDDFGAWYVQPQFLVGMLGGFAALGLVLVCIGVYSVLSYSVSQRTHEIGVRMALGAEATDVRIWVLKAGLRWLLVGIGVGVPASIALAKILQNRIWGIKSADPLTLVAVSLLLIVVGFAACYFPARRATKVDPMVALRCE